MKTSTRSASSRSRRDLPRLSSFSVLSALVVVTACASDSGGGPESTPTGAPLGGTATAPGSGMAPPSGSGSTPPANPVTPVMASGDVVSMTTQDDGTTVVQTSDGTTTTTSPDGTVTAVAADGTSTTTLPDGTVTTVAPDGTTTTLTPDGVTTTTAPDGTVTVVGPDGTTTTTAPPGSMPGGEGDPTPDNSSDPDAAAGVWINQRGRVDADDNSFGIQGDWYAFGDGVTTDQSGNPYRDGKYCVTGQADGDSANWGAGIGLDLNGVGGEKQPYAYEGKLTGFRIQFSGEVPAEPRLHFVIDPELGVNPFIPVTLGETLVYNIADAQVPFSWGVDNAGQRVEGELYALQVLAPGDAEAGPIDLCIETFEPIYDESAAGSGAEGTTYINSDGYVTADDNSYGISGPIYVISDGVSTTQSGVPYVDGKYCVAGEFSGGADDWGAGIAFDLNKPPGGQLAAFDPSSGVAGFRVGLSGNSPGNVRIQYVINDPQEGDQPFLVAQMNTTAMYPIDWAQVPTSWEVSNAGAGVGSSLYTLQVYIEGDVPGPFEVCIEDLAPLSADEMSYGASPAADGYNGFRTIDPGMLQQEYETWKSRHFQDCGDGSACIPRDEGDCISEGVAYGMLLAVGHDDQDAFDKLWAYFSKHKNGAGMMKWQTNACGAATQEGSATDGDLDAAMALIQAGCRWGGSYESEAVTLINAIGTNAVASCSTGTVLKPGDNFGGCDETDPSYITPAYYRVFQQLTGNDVWSELLESGYGLLAANQQRKAGLWSDWSNETGGVSAGNHRDDFGPDASRVPWRLANDYMWFGEERAAALLDTFRDTIESNGGPAWNFTPNSNYRGGSAFSAIHTDAATAHEFTDAWLLTSVDDDTYFPGTLRRVYMLLAANNFPKGCD